jgi:hypothetical protein
MAPKSTGSLFTWHLITASLAIAELMHGRDLDALEASCAGSLGDDVNTGCCSGQLVKADSTAN